VIEARLRAIINTAVDGIILIDCTGKVTMFNPACEYMFGRRAADVVGGDIDRLMPGSFPQGQGDDLVDCQRKGLRKISRNSREVVGLRCDGRTFPLDLSVGEAEHEGEVFYVGILRDVTERKRAEELRGRFTEQLTIANRWRTNFSHAASHDLREPLRMTAAFCGMLSKEYGERLDDRGREFLSLAISATAEMRELLDGLIAFDRLDQEAERGVWFDSDAYIDEALEHLEDSITASGAQITRGQGPRIFGNPVRFHRLMRCLIGNALKFGRSGVAPRIEVSASREDDFWRFSVSDNGIGIEPRHQESVFEPFARLHAKRRYPGAGLGLSISRRIVEGFGGRIWLTSVPGEGSTFCFTVKSECEEAANDQCDD
jgi:PAS domain S-box-containing protein